MKEEKTIYSLILIALLTVSAYFLADTVDAMIGRSLEAAPKITSAMERNRPALEPRRELSDYSSILERGLFGEGKGPSGGPAQASAPSTYVLIGTIEGEHFSGAVLDSPANPQAFYRLNEKLPDGSRIIKVKHDSVSLKLADGSVTVVQMEDATKIVMATPTAAATPGVRQLSKDKWMLDQREVAASTENMNQILTQARALPYMEAGKTIGFRISEIVAGSIYEKIGLKNGDVIQKVNAQDVDDPGKFFQLYQGLKEEKSITIDLMRNGQRQTLNYEIR
jgi:general secretion pathway protein C